MTRYRILIADPLLQIGPQWPPGYQLVQQLEPGPAGTHWHLFDDPDAPADLDGREVDLTLARGEDGQPVITARRPVVTHQAPEDGGSGLMPCCGLPPWELPRHDRMTAGAESVTCGGARAAGEPYVVDDGGYVGASGLDRLRATASGGDAP
jgi:hypothetical protein